MGESGIAFGAVGKGAIWGLLAALILTALAALFLSFTENGSAYAQAATTGVGWLSVLVGGVVAGQAAGRSGLLHGAVTGVVVVLLAVAIGALAFDAQIIGVKILLRGGIALVVGAAGGAMGVAI